MIVIASAFPVVPLTVPVIREEVVDNGPKIKEEAEVDVDDIVPSQTAVPVIFEDVTAE